MRNNRINYIIVGTFVLAMLIGLVVSVAMLTGRTGATDSYYSVYDNVSGIKYGTQVLYQGYPIGQVEEVVPVQQEGQVRFRVNFSVKSGWQIPEDSVAQITSSGLLAAVTINIHAGDSKQALKPGTQVTGGEAVNLMGAMSSIAAQVTDLSEHSIKPLLANLNKSVGSFGDILESDGKGMVAQLRAMVEQLNARTPQITKELQSFAERMNQGGKGFSDLFNDKNQTRIEQALDNLAKASKQFSELTSDLAKTRALLDKLIQDSDSLVAKNDPTVTRSMEDMRHVMEVLAGQIDSISHNLDLSSRNFYEFSRQIRQNPSLLLSSKPPKDAAQ